MMDEFFEYWEILPECTKYESIGQEIVRYKRNLNDSDVSSIDLSENVIEFLQTKLLESPYPTNNIIYHILDTKDHEKNQLLEEIILNTLIKLIDLIVEDPNVMDKKFKLFNLLSNISISESKMHKLHYVIIPALYDLKENHHLLDHVLYFALLSRSSLSLLNHYLEYEHSRILEKFNESTIFLKCYYQRKHWIDAMFNPENDDIIKGLLNETFYKNLTICRMIVNHESFPKQVFMEINPSVIENKFLHLCYLELSRQNAIMNFLTQHSQTTSLTVDTTKSHIMTQLIKLFIPFSMEKYEMILELLKYNYDTNMLQLEKYHAGHCEYNFKTEMQLFNEYMIIKLYLSKILQKDTTSESSEVCVNHIRRLLKTINDGSILFNIMQSVLFMIFVRYEHVRKTRLRQRSMAERSSYSSSNQNNCSNSTDVSENIFIDSYNNHGFICSKNSLEIILNSLRLFLMSLDITEAYKNCDDDLKKKFSNLLKAVDHGLWKLQVIENNNKQSSRKEIDSSIEWLVVHDDSIKNVIPQDKIADEENVNARRRSIRKKLRKKSKSSAQSEKSNDFEKNSVQEIENSCTTDHSILSTNRIILLEPKKSEDFIAKMLMKPESLIALCVKNYDRENTTKIIKDYNLKDTSIEKEINFINHYEQTLNNLKSIAARYNELRESENSGHSINGIKSFAEVGFEAAKLIDALEKYCKTSDLSHVDANEMSLEKISQQMPNLHVYKKSMLILTACIDFMISLPDQYDITLMISNFISKKWNFIDHEKGVYFVGFFKKITEIFGIYHKTNDQITLGHLLNNEIYSFEPSLFRVQMENRKNFKSMLEIDMQELNEEPVLQDLLTKMEKFKSKINFFGRIYSYVKNVRFIAKFQTNDFLNINEIIKNLNIYDLIGTIVYVHQYNPDLLVNYAFSSNINLLHAISIAGGTEFLSPLWKCQKLIESSENSECPKKYFNISNTNILYYVKKSGSFLVAYLIKEIQDFNYQSLKYDEPNFLERMKELESIKSLRQLYGDNATVTALNYDYIDMNLLYHEMCKLDEIEKLTLLSKVNERNIDRMRSKFYELKDACIETLMEQDASKIETLLREVGNINKFNELLLKYVKDIKSDKELEDLLTLSLCGKNQKNIKDKERMELEEWLKKIKIYRQILALFHKTNMQENITWINIMELAENNTSVLINFLINVSTDLELCNKLLKFHPLESKNEEIYKIFIEALNKRKFNEQHDVLFKIIQNFSTKFLLDFFDYSLDYIHNMESMKFLLNFLLAHDMTLKNHIRYQKFQISCTIISHLDEEDLQLWSLAAYPLILLEQMLMNSKIEILNGVIKKLRILLEGQPSCNLCNATNTTNKNYQIGEILVYDFDAYHKGYKISNDCLDFLFKIYAAKALDFQIIDVPCQSNPSTHSGAQSDTTIHVHQIPKEIPSRDQWVPDNEAIFCMCCKKSKFSLLNRRHHCRRCGNVICGECSRKRILLPERYNDLMVRCCDECYSQMESRRKKLDFGNSEKSNKSTDLLMEWKLTGDIEKDQMIRDEFNFEYSPNVGRCIAIFCLHTINDEFTNFLLFHCHRLELLLHPINGQLNPEIDVILVGSMLKYLAKTAKLFGDIGESSVIIDQIDIILKLAENECDSILSKASFNAVTNNLSTRDIINELIRIENWKLALDLSVKWDRNSTSGVFSAWAVSLIKGGHYKLAREKMALAIQPVSGSSAKINEDFMATMKGDIPMDMSKFQYKRPVRSSPLLCEILEIIEATVPKFNRKEPLVQMNSRESSKSTTANSMDYLKKIMDGDYGGAVRKISEKLDWNQIDLQKSPYYEESIHYLISYGGNSDILEFFMKNNLIKFAIRYTLVQKISYDMFIQYIIIPTVKSGRLADFMNTLKEIDENFTKSKNYIITLCKYLDRKKSLHVLYQVQLLIEDNIRAALTSLKFYLDGSGNYTELNEKSRHLLDAKNHLQLELERVESDVVTNRNDIQLKWDIKSINAQINIILLQLEVSKYLANCELNGYPTLDLMPKVFLDKISLKTLLGKAHEKSHVAILLLICGHSIESSFGLCYRIIQECSLKSFKIYSTCTKYLARDLKRLIEIEKLINCIKTNASCGENTTDPETERMCDDLICMAVEIAYMQHSSDAKIQIDKLIKLISCTTMKIQCYINSNQLKTAFVHSAALNNLDYIKRIMKQAESTRQENIRRLCEKKLQQSMCSSMGSESGNLNTESTNASDHK